MSRKNTSYGQDVSNTRMVDYFVTSGLDINSGLEPNSIPGVDSIQCAPLEQSYKCKVLQHYPETVASNPFDSNAVCMLSLPNGLQFRTQKHSREAKFHNFIITKENGERYYGSSFIFYEEVKNKKICSAMQILQSMHITELSSGSGDTTGSKRQKMAQQLDHNTQSLPRHFKLSSHHNRSALSYYDFTKDSLFVCKSIALISQHSYVQAPCQFLNSVYNSWLEQGELSLESYVFYILYEVAMPCPGTSLSFLSYPDIITYLVSPKLDNELPHFDFPIRQVFVLMGVDTFIQLFTCVLLEKQILICSSDYQKLMLVAESLCCLLFPFKWPHVYVPILPSSMYHFLDAPVPYIMGLHGKESKMNIPSEFSLCFVDLDTRNVQFPEDTPSVPQKSEIMTDIYHLLNKYNVHIPNYSDSCPKYKLPSNIMSSSCMGALPTSIVRGRKHSWSNELDDADDSDSLLSSSDTLRRMYIERGILMTPDSSLSKLNAQDSFFNNRESDKYISNSRSSLNALDTSDFDDGLSSYNSIEDRFDTNLSDKEYYCKEIKFNIALREMFLRRLVHIFANYETFIIQNTQDKEEWLNNRESMQNFDKTSFLSDQSKHSIPFLSLFLETQMFATFIDSKIASSWGEIDNNLTLFESRIRKYNKIHSSDGYYSSTSHEMINLISDHQLLLEKRLAKVHKELAKPKEILTSYAPVSPRGNFPLLDVVALSQELSNRTKSSNLTWSLKRNEKKNSEEISLYKKPFSNEANPLGSKFSNVRLSIAQTERKITQDNSIIPQTNWNFVEKLLKDCKTRTKKMLVEKLGNEALELGHVEESNENSIVEENTLIAGLCDILERIWSHGLQHKQGKSALWSHLCIYLEVEKQNTNSLTNSMSTLFGRSPKLERKFKTASNSPYGSNKDLTKAGNSPCYEKPPLPKRDSLMTSSFSERSQTPTSDRMSSSFYEKSPSDKSITSSMYKAMTSSLERNKSKSPDRSVPFERNSRKMLRRSSDTRSHSESRILSECNDYNAPRLPPLSTDLLFDVKNIQAMTEIKTPIGFARAWVRLSLERKLLSKHFKTLLSNNPLLKLLYKRYAFLRCEEEREQFLYHLLTLNAVDYNCFTNTFVNTNMTYRVLIIPSKRSNAFTSANCWISIGGNLGDTKKIPIPKNTLEFIYHSRNVGQLTTLRIGHDNTGLNSKWLIDNILVRNEITGATYNFHCGKWLGKGIDDDSIERLLLGEKIIEKPDDSCPSTPKSPRIRSPSIPPSKKIECLGEIETLLGECINNIVKYFHRSDKESPQSSLTVLLLGESGLVYCMEQIFLYGFKSSRLFSRNLNIWDLFIKIYSEIKTEKRTSQSYEDLTRDTSDTIVDLYQRSAQETLDNHTKQLFELKLNRSETKKYFTNLIQVIEENDNLNSLGRDGRFQLFVLLSLKHRMLDRILSCVISCSQSVQEMYEDKCLFKNSYHLELILNMLLNLNSYKFSLENSLTYGINYDNIMQN